jgi:hypothetical protein
MEDASAVDLDWFWRGWFYSTDNVDISLDNVKWFQLNTQNPEIEKGIKEQTDKAKDKFIGDTRNKISIAKTINENDAAIDDFYAKRNSYKVDALERKEFEAFNAKLSEEDRKLLNSNKQFYELSFSNLGGLVSPIIIEATFDDNSTEVVRIPAEIWRMYEEKVSKVLIFDKQVISFKIDPFLETADTDLNNNSWPARVEPTRFDMFKEKQTVRENPMQRQKRVEAIGN